MRVTFSPLTVEPAYLRAMGEAVLAAQWQAARVVAAAQFGVRGVVFQATFRQN